MVVVVRAAAPVGGFAVAVEYVDDRSRGKRVQGAVHG
jgi:hypothetical protein